MARKVADRAGLQLECEIPDALEGISPATEQAIYRITQEALENVVRHADARKVFIQLGWFNKQLVLVISDDGRGFDSTVLNDSDRLGMKGMQERAAMVGGELKVVSQPHQGTIIRFTLDGRHDKSFDL
jgi:signal transduction histidine kinase